MGARGPWTGFNFISIVPDSAGRRLKLVSVCGQACKGEFSKERLGGLYVGDEPTGLEIDNEFEFALFSSLAR